MDAQEQQEEQEEERIIHVFERRAALSSLWATRHGPAEHAEVLLVPLQAPAMAKR